MVVGAASSRHRSNVQVGGQVAGRCLQPGRRAHKGLGLLAGRCSRGKSEEQGATGWGVRTNAAVGMGQVVLVRSRRTPYDTNSLVSEAYDSCWHPHQLRDGGNYPLRCKYVCIMYQVRPRSSFPLSPAPARHPPSCLSCALPPCDVPRPCRWCGALGAWRRSGPPARGAQPAPRSDKGCVNTSGEGSALT
jgi:hypothetical protein